MAQRELILRLRELGDGMEQALNDDAFARMHNISAAMAAASMPSDDGLSRPTAAAVFWPETVRAVGALLQESQTAKLQRDQLFQTVRMWEEHKPVDLESPRNEQVNITSNFNACQVRSDMRARAHRLADIHATMTNHKDWVAMVSSTLGIEVRAGPGAGHAGSVAAAASILRTAAPSNLTMLARRESTLGLPFKASTHCRCAGCGFGRSAVCRG
jgi:hypothetical protein